jgi:hypothetical protein
MGGRRMSGRCGVDRCDEQAEFRAFSGAVAAEGCAAHLAAVVRFVKSEDLAEAAKPRKKGQTFTIVRDPGEPIVVTAL